MKYIINTFLTILKINEIYFIITNWRLKLRFQCSKSQKYQIMNIIKETINKNDDKTNPSNSHANYRLQNNLYILMMHVIHL